MKDSSSENPIATMSVQVAEADAEQTGELLHSAPGPEVSTWTYDALVLDARLRQSLVALRSLGRKGLRVAALETTKDTPAFSSRWCQQSYCAPSYEYSPEPYLTYLMQLLDQTGARVLITSSDGTMALMRRYREQLEKRVQIALAKETALELAINKEQTLEIARQLRLGVPRSVTVSSVSEVTAALHEIGLPAVVKPVESWLWGERQGEKLLCKLVTTPDEARLAVEELTCSGGTTLFQQYLPGIREAVSFLYANDTMYARFAQWARRTQPPLGGTSVLRQSIAVPDDIGEQAERLVREIELEGYSEIEFRRDGAGKPYLMEINPRLSASVEIAVRSGVDFPYLLYQWANGDRIDIVKSYRVGGWMRYLQGDIVTTVQCWHQRGRPGVTPPAQALFEFFITFLKPMGYDYIDWTDPIPACVATAGFSRFLLQKLGSSLLRRKSP